MEHAITWVLWAVTAVVPFLGLAWCLTSPPAEVRRTPEIAETSPEP